MVSLKITQDSRKYLTVVKANQKLPINTSGSSETNPAICRVEIYLLLENDKEYFNSKMTDIMSWAQKNKCNIAFTTASMALKDGFIKESAFDDFNYPVPKKYKALCDIYSASYFNLFNRRKL